MPIARVVSFEGVGKDRMEQMQREVNEFMEYVKHELARGLGDWEQRLSTALVKSAPTDLVPARPPKQEEPREQSK